MTDAEILGIGRQTLDKGLTWQKVTRCTDSELIAFARAVAAREVAERNDLLGAIAYPKRGTEEERLDIFEAAELVQAKFTAADLGR